MSVKRTRLGDILVKARGLIADPDDWCRNAFARDAHGFELCEIDDIRQRGVSHCVLGALWTSLPERYEKHYESNDIDDLRDDILSEANLRLEDDEYEYGEVSEWNDAVEHSRVLEVLDSLIGNEKIT